MNITHPEDKIYKVKTFINELQEVQKVYFDNLVSALKMNKNGEEFLFDYIYNSLDDVDDFTHYLQTCGKTYQDMVHNDMMHTDLNTVYHSSDFGEFNPMVDMSSYEPDLETSFPPYNSDEPVLMGLDSISFNTLSACVDTK